MMTVLSLTVWESGSEVIIDSQPNTQERQMSDHIFLHKLSTSKRCQPPEVCPVLMQDFVLLKTHNSVNVNNNNKVSNLTALHK